MTTSSTGPIPVLRISGAPPLQPSVRAPGTDARGGGPAEISTTRPPTSEQSPAVPDDPADPDARTDHEVDVARTFEDFYLETRTEIGRAVALVLGNPDLAAEATDEAYTRACERWSRIRGGNPSGWVYRVALNWALSVLRQHRRSPHRLYQPLTDDPGPPEPAVHTAMAALDPKHRSVVVCRHLLGWSVAETAAALRIREGTVKSRLSRATKVLATQLDHLRPDAGPAPDPGSVPPLAAGDPAAPPTDQEQP